MSQESRWQILIKQGRRAYQRQSYFEAERDLCLALKIAEQFGERDQRLVASLSELAEFYWASGDAARANLFMKQAVALGKKILNRRQLHNLLKRAEEIAQLPSSNVDRPLPN